MHYNQRRTYTGTKIEEFLPCLSTDLECNQETTHPTENNQHDMQEEDEQHGPNQEMDQEYHDHIEHWF